jgi:hypothetical protein
VIVRGLTAHDICHDPGRKDGTATGRRAGGSMECTSVLR